MTRELLGRKQRRIQDQYALFGSLPVQETVPVGLMMVGEFGLVSFLDQPSVHLVDGTMDQYDPVVGASAFGHSIDDEVEVKLPVIKKVLALWSCQ